MNLSIYTSSLELKYTESETNTSTLLESHCHFRFELIAVMSGCVDIIIEGKSFRCESGEVALIPPLTYHSVIASGDSAYKRITALFEGSAFPKSITEKLVANSNSSPIYSPAALPFMTESLHRAMMKDETDIYSPLIDAIVLQIIYTCAEEEAKDTKNASVKDNDLLERAINYVDMHICEKITLDGMAESLFISSSSLCHIFSERMQISPKQYVIKKKMAYATMLIEKGIPLTQAARAIGYENYSNFYRMYKRTNQKGG